MALVYVDGSVDDIELDLDDVAKLRRCKTVKRARSALISEGRTSTTCTSSFSSTCRAQSMRARTAPLRIKSRRIRGTESPNRRDSDASGTHV